MCRGAKLIGIMEIGVPLATAHNVLPCMVTRSGGLWIERGCVKTVP